MTIQKNVASQRLHWLMVDATDFATPETGITVSAYYIKDGSARSTCSNSVSEITSGMYKITLAATETDADVVTYQFTGSGCADNYIVMYPESGYKSQLSSIEADVAAVLVDTGTTLPATLSGLESLLDSAIDGPITSILGDTGTTLPATLSGLESTLDSAIDGPLASILADTITLSNADYGLNALETIASQIKSTIDAPITDFLTSIVDDTSKIHSTLDGPVASQLSSVEADTAAILTDTGTTLNALISDVLSTIDGPLDSAVTQNTALISDVLSTIDGPVISDLTAIETDTGTTLNGLISDILSTVDGPIHSTLDAIHSTIDGTLDSAVTQNTALISDVLSTIDGAGLKPTTAEPAAGAPSATAPTGVKIDHLYTVFRNKIETTSGTQKVYDDAGTTVLYSCALSDDATTFTKAEHA